MNNKYLQELAVSYIKDKQLELTEENKTKLYGILLTHRDDVLKQTPYYEDLDGSYTRQQSYFYQVLDDELEPINEVFMIPILIKALHIMATIGLGYLAFVNPNAIKVAIVKLSESIKKVIDKISERLDNSETYEKAKKEYDEIKVAQKILDDKYSSCSAKCGLVDKKLQVSDIKLGTAFLNMTNIPQDAKPNEVACVITCTLDYLTSVIAELHKTLVSCNQNFADKNNPDSPVNDINFDANCNEIKSYLKDIVKDFEDIVNIIYKDNVKGKNTWKQILDDKIVAVMKNQSVSNFGPTDSEYKSLQLLSNKPKPQNNGGFNGKSPNNFRRN